MVYFCYSLVFNCVWLVSKRVVYYHPFFVPSRNQVQTRLDHKSNCKMYDRSWTLGMLLCCTVALIKTSACAVAKAALHQTKVQLQDV